MSVLSQNFPAPVELCDLCWDVTEAQFNCSCSLSTHLYCWLGLWSLKVKACKREEQRVASCPVGCNVSDLEPEDKAQLHWGLKQVQKETRNVLFHGSLYFRLKRKLCISWQPTVIFIPSAGKMVPMSPPHLGSTCWLWVTLATSQPGGNLESTFCQALTTSGFHFFWQSSRGCNHPWLRSHHTFLSFFFFFYKHVVTERSANRQDVHGDLLQLTLLVEVVGEWLADKCQIRGLSQHVVFGLFSQRGREFLKNFFRSQELKWQTFAQSSNECSIFMSCKKQWLLAKRMQKLGVTVEQMFGCDDPLNEKSGKQ